MWDAQPLHHDIATFSLSSANSCRTLFWAGVRVHLLNVVIFPYVQSDVFLPLQATPVLLYTCAYACARVCASP
jgi:hypothetical protein